MKVWKISVMLFLQCGGIMNLRNLEAEKSVIGALLLEPKSLDETSRLHPDDFSESRLGILFETIRELSHRNEPIDIVTLTTDLRHKGKLEEVGGTSYLMEMVEFVPTAAVIKHYVRMVLDAATRRRLTERARKIIQVAHEAETAADALDLAESSLMELRNASHYHGGAEALGRLIPAALKQLGANAVNSGPIGTPTGIHHLDRMTAGLHGGDLIIIAGRPSMGKTALGVNIAVNSAIQGHRALVFSLEMSQEQLVNRILSGTAKVDAQNIRTGDLTTGDWDRLTEAADRLHRLPLLIEDSPMVTVMDIRATARREKRKGGLDLIVIDYLQLIRPVKSHNTREREVSEISRSLKALAKELNTPVVVLAQLNRNMESGAKPRKPIPSDLRESGSLEQDADVILFPWREAAYCPQCRKGVDCGTGHLYLAEIIVGKQRNGPIGSVRVAWMPEFTRFENITRGGENSIPGQGRPA